MAGVPRYTGYNWERPSDGLVGNITHPQKGDASLSCGKELRRGIEHPARIESWKESNNNNYYYYYYYYYYIIIIIILLIIIIIIIIIMIVIIMIVTIILIITIITIVMVIVFCFRY